MKNGKLEVNLNNSELTIRKESIETLLTRMGLKGEGTLDDPIIIDSTSSLPLILTLNTGDLHIRLRNLFFTKLTLVCCRNIVIEKCKILKFYMHRCQNITVNNSSLLRAEHFLSKANTFENNEIHKDSHKSLTKNRYEIQEILVMIVAALFGSYAILLSITGFTYQGINAINAFIFGVSLICLGFSGYLAIFKMKMRDLEPNRIVNSKITPLEDLINLPDIAIQPNLIAPMGD